MKVETTIKVDGKVLFDDTFEVSGQNYVQQYADAVAALNEWLFFKAGVEGGCR